MSLLVLRSQTPQRQNARPKEGQRILLFRSDLRTPERRWCAKEFSILDARGAADGKASIRLYVSELQSAFGAESHGRWFQGAWDYYSAPKKRAPAWRAQRN